MSLDATLPTWLTALREQADEPPRVPRLPLWVGVVPVGSVEADFGTRMASAVPHYFRAMPFDPRHPERVGWQIVGELTSSLAIVAKMMQAQGLTGTWRDEELSVRDQNGRKLGTVERAAVRPLGIPTRAVHLLGRHPDGRHWVQRRALSKANDPGQWDTLMGGMVSASDTLTQALARETREEAGLALSEVHCLAAGGTVRIQRPATDGGGCGYVVEQIDWFSCVVPEGVTPVNQDGEVDEFRLMTQAELLERMSRNEFTLEAALIIWQALHEG